MSFNETTQSKVYLGVIVGVRGERKAKGESEREMKTEVQLEPMPNKADYEEAQCIFGRANRLVTLKFEDVVYKININKSSYLSCGGNQETKMILKGATGVVQPREMMAMLGPSGSGKTTLLTALGGRLGGKLLGTITYNGKPLSSAMKRNIGFVTQDDVLYPHLTVTETLVFTALLRLPNSLRKEEKEKQAKAVLAQLGLTKCKDNIVGGQFVRGVSGGERRRVSIGQEILIDPSLLLLDEPTSGLDSTTAQRIVSMLMELAQGGRTVVMTIHQPSNMIFSMVHKVLLLSEGHPIYFGGGSDALEYFESVGHAPFVPMNPADFLLDLANGISSNDSERRMAVKDALISAYDHNLRNKLKEDLKKIYSQRQESSDDKKIGRWSTTWWQQFTVLLRRGVKERRHETFSGLKSFQVLVSSVITGLLWWQSDIAHLQDQIGLLFFYTVFWAFFPLFQAILAFPQERAMLTKERSSGMYRLSSYFMARMAGDMPMELVLPACFLTITYWMAGLQPTAANYFMTLSVLLFIVVVAQSLGLALGALVMDLKSATTLGSVIMLTFMLAGGYYVQHVPVFIAWVKYISISQYSYKLLLASQYSAGEMYPCGSSSLCPVSEFPSIKLVGLDNVGISIIALLVMTVSYRLIAYFALMRVGVIS